MTEVELLREINSFMIPLELKATVVVLSNNVKIMYIGGWSCMFPPALVNPGGVYAIVRDIIVSNNAIATIGSRKKWG